MELKAADAISINEFFFAVVDVLCAPLAGAWTLRAAALGRRSARRGRQTPGATAKHRTRPFGNLQWKEV